jgi:hypothetical protein
VVGQTVTVRLVEQNDLYDALGAGTGLQVVEYGVLGGRISRMRTRAIAYSGRSFPETFRAFEAWLLTTRAASNETLMRDGHVRHTAASAKALAPWLRKWAERRD